MKERPILFSAPMVRALLDGSKTQTRRVVKLRALAGDYFEGGAAGVEFDGFRIPRDCGPAPARFSAEAVGGGAFISEELPCPYGAPGDRIWVRETWGVVSNDWDGNGAPIDWTPNRPAMAISEMPFGKGYYSGHVIYAADGSYEWAGDDDGGGEPRSAWHPSIHMPRAASRILLEIVSVRVERLNDCSEADAKAEGVKADRAGGHFIDTPTARHAAAVGMPAVEAYQSLWESINGAGSWAANPWVWVIEFKRVTP